MTREEKVAWLVANREEWKGEEGSEILNALSPTRVDTIFDTAQASGYFQQVANLAADGFVHNGAAYRFDPDQGSFVTNMCDEEDMEYDEEGNPVKKKAPPMPATNAEANTPLTLNELYERGDSQVKAMIETWKEHDTKVRHDSLVKLTNNCRSDEAKQVTANSLNKLSTRELQQMADAVTPVDHGAPQFTQHTPHRHPNFAVPPASYAGASGAPAAPAQNRDQSSVLELPTNNFDEGASPRLLQHLKNGSR